MRELRELTKKAPVIANFDTKKMMMAQKELETQAVTHINFD
jgi:hypothetical protein